MPKSAENAAGNNDFSGAQIVMTCAQVRVVAAIAFLIASSGFSRAAAQESVEAAASNTVAGVKVQAKKTAENGADSENSVVEQPPGISGKDIVADDRIDMLEADLTRNWKFFSSKTGVAFGDVWKLVSVGKERHLICVGEPKGFLYTEHRYDNFEMTFEWKYTADPNGNSGILVFTNDEPRLWPTSMQIQLHQPRAGSIFPSGDATSDGTTEATDLAVEIGKWNTCRIVATGGRLSVEINGKPAGEVSGCKPSMGSIALQSEGSETHFRKMFLRKLLSPPSATETAPTNEVVKPKATPISGV